MLKDGRLAQLGEHSLDVWKVTGSNPAPSIEIEVQNPEMSGFWTFFIFLAVLRFFSVLCIRYTFDQFSHVKRPVNRQLRVDGLLDLLPAYLGHPELQWFCFRRFSPFRRDILIATFPLFFYLKKTVTDHSWSATVFMEATGFEPATPHTWSECSPAELSFHRLLYTGQSENARRVFCFSLPCCGIRVECNCQRGG